MSFVSFFSSLIYVKPEPMAGRNEPCLSGLMEVKELFLWLLLMIGLTIVSAKDDTSTGFNLPLSRSSSFFLSTTV